MRASTSAAPVRSLRSARCLHRQSPAPMIVLQSVATSVRHRLPAVTPSVSASRYRAFSSSSSSSLVPSSSRPPPVSPFVPLGHAPRLPEVLALPIDKPILPGLTFDLPLSAFSDATRQALVNQLNKKIPYIGLFLIKDDSGQSEIQESKSVSTSDTSSSTSVSAGTSAADADAEVTRQSFPPVTALEQIHTVGTFVQFIIVSDRIKGHVHRRIVARTAASDSGPLYVSVEHIEEVEQKKKTASAIVNVNEDDSIAHTITGVDTSADSNSYNQSPFGYIDEHELAAYVKELALTMHELAQLTNIQQRSVDVQGRMINSTLDNNVSPSRLADLYASFAKSTPVQLQSVLETFDAAARLNKTLILLRVELEEAKLSSTIMTKIQEKMTAANHRHVLKEQKKVIDSMLGIGTSKNDREMLKQKYLDRIKDKNIPATVCTVIEEELNKISLNENDSSQEFHLIKNYLDWLTLLPWGVYSRELLNISVAESVLNAEHYGLEDVKSRILELIASGVLLGAMPNGKTLCLVGPPGTGKTSIGQSIAQALGRKFYRFSVGGMDDVAEIKGHRRTYVGSMPGKIIQNLKLGGVSNPVIMLDEIDKMGRGYRGDPAAALLEVLDPEQNASFIDHYLDVPYDLSKVLFICTANSADTIPAPLADRMDFIHLSGYTWQEKLEIGRRYLEPQARSKNGISDSELHITDSALLYLIRWYAREAGVRNLSKLIDKIYRKVALKFARGNDSKIVIDDSNISDYVGKPLFTSDRMYEVTPTGVAMGLAWTSHGGQTIFIESSVADQRHPSAVNKQKLQRVNDGIIEDEHPSDNDIDAPTGFSPMELFTTGQLGDVMRESSIIAYTVAKRVYSQLKPHSAFFRRHRLHLHVPAGSTPKDGPSAGITMASALLSLSLNTPMKQSVAMTGELTVTGRVLAIGGVKEKTIAAKHSLVTEIILPADNRRDWDELPDYIKEGIAPHFVSDFEQVLKIVMPQFAVKLGAAKKESATHSVASISEQPTATLEQTGTTH